MPRIKLQPLRFTGAENSSRNQYLQTGSSLALGAKSKMDVIVSDTGGDVVEKPAAETPTLEPEPEQQREFQTPLLPIKT